MKVVFLSSSSTSPSKTWATTTMVSIGAWLIMSTPGAHSHAVLAAGEDIQLTTTPLTIINSGPTHRNLRNPSHNKEEEPNDAAAASFATENNQKKKNNKIQDRRFLEVMECDPDAALELQLDENCLPSTCNICAEEGLFDNLNVQKETTEAGSVCVARRTVEFMLVDEIIPVIACGLPDYTAAQCSGVPVPVDYCNGDYTPPPLDVTDNCQADSESTVSPIVVTGDKCAGRDDSRVYIADDGCNNADPITINFRVNPATITVSPSEDALTAECKDGNFPSLPVTETVCSTDTEDNADPVSDFVTSCGETTVEYTYTDECGVPHTFNRTVMVTDNDDPVIRTPLPADADVCDAPTEPVELCADDCQGELCEVAFPIAQGTPTVCAGGSYTRTWTFVDGCGNDKTHTQTITIAGKQVSAPYASGEASCGEDPVVCVDVTPCGESETTICSNDADPVVASRFTFNTPSGTNATTSDICSEDPQTDGAAEPSITKTVHYDDPNGCDTEADITFPSGCCCETDFAVFNPANPNVGIPSQCFIQMTNVNIQGRRWGWTIGPLNFATEATTTHPIYGGAGQCDTLKGYLVGEATIKTMPGTPNKVEVSISAPFEVNSEQARFTVFHIFVGNDILPTGNNGAFITSPGQYGFTKTFPTGTTDAFTKTFTRTTKTRVNINSTGAYVVIHAVSALSCSNEHYDR
ncbi:hypothetical protein ACA910_014626 [Epithemia clementina (nom. ined.)]